MDFTGYVQVDAVVYSQASQDQLDPGSEEPLNEEHFGIPRASLRADARRGALAGELELEGFTTRATVPHQTQTSGVRLETAEVRWHHREWVEIVAGVFRTPFGANTPTSPRDRAFLELPTMSRALFPGDLDAGIMARGAFGLARWSIAMMNGAPIGDGTWKGKDPTSSYDIVGRVGADVPGPYRSRFIVGLSALTGTALHPGTPPTKDELQWVDENQDGIVQTTELQVIPGSPAEPSQTFDHHALGADLQVHWCLCALGRGTAFGEVVLATNLDRALIYADPVAASRNYRELGVTIGFVQEVGAHARFGARYDRYAGDRDANLRAGIQVIGIDKIFSTLALIGVAHWGELQLTGEYDHERNPFGRGDDGTPLTREADRLTFRAQVGF